MSFLKWINLSTSIILLIVISPNLMAKTSTKSDQKKIESSSAMKSKSAFNIDLKVEKYQLDNGMKVVLHVDRRIPMISVHQWYDVGSFHEDRNRTGLAHFFEHLMFKGTAKFPDGKFDEIVSKKGGQNNAFTSRDYTGYFEIVPSSSLEQMLELESDRMINLALNDLQIQKEREVVKEERRMRTENSPDGYIFEVMMEKIFQGHPYSSSVIGSMEHLNNTELKDFMAFYKKFYAPNNSTLILVGDFDVVKAKALIKKYYSKIPKSQLPEIKNPALPLIQKNFVLKENKKFDERKISIYFQAPKMGARDGFVLDVICEILAGDDASPISKILIDQKKMSTSVSFWNYSLKYAGAVSFNADIIGKKPFVDVENVFFSQVQNLQKNGVTNDQLQKAKDKISFEYIDALKTIGGKARVLAQSEVVRGDYKSFFTDLNEYQSVTNEEIISVAKKFLNRNQSQIIYLGK